MGPAIGGLCFITELEEPSVAERRPFGAGEVAHPVKISSDTASRLAVVAARRASGLTPTSRRSEVLWTDADGRLAVGVGGVDVRTGNGLAVVTIPVRCDQTGRESVSVTFAVGDPKQPAGMFAATERIPRGPGLIVDTWGDALVAFAWQILLDIATDVAATVDEDPGGDRLVPAQVTATDEGLEILPMGRHRIGRLSRTDIAPARVTRDEHQR